MEQKALSDFWKFRADISKTEKIRWQELIGAPLRSFAYKYAQAGLPVEEAERLIIGSITEKGILVDPRILDCLRSGLSAGYTEYKRTKVIQNNF